MLILASNSPRRKELLTSVGIDFKVVASNIEEKAEYFLPESLPLILAEKKARNIAERYPDLPVLAADTVVIFKDKIFNKPLNLNDAINMLMTLSGNIHKVVTGVNILKLNENISIKFSETSSVQFNTFTRDIAENYTKLVHVLDKAGAYAVQEHGKIIIKEIIGSESNVIGLPLQRTIQALNSIGISST
jgi:septum formation protein